MKTSSLACKGRAPKASKLRKNGKIFVPEKVGLPLHVCNAAPSTTNQSFKQNCSSIVPFCCFSFQLKKQVKQRGCVGRVGCGGVRVVWGGVGKSWGGVG